METRRPSFLPLARFPGDRNRDPFRGGSELSVHCHIRVSGHKLSRVHSADNPGGRGLASLSRARVAFVCLGGYVPGVPFTFAFEGYTLPEELANKK